MSLRNVAIIAHVDHGKTTLVDQLLKQAGSFHENEKVAERAMDSNDLEKERGITILAKCTSILWKDTRINIVDTPGHADFGGEVERILSMVDGVVLLVDSAESVLPQTKFVLGKALGRGLRPIVVVNKVDRPDARPHTVHDEIFDLFAALDASPEQLDFPMLFASGRNGWAVKDLEDERKDLTPLFELIINHVPEPKVDVNAPFSMLATILGADPWLGRTLTGRVETGKVKMNAPFKALTRDGALIEQGRITKILTFRGLERVPVEEASAGDIVIIAGMTKATVADTLCDPSIEKPIPAQPIDPPTIAITFSVNDSPLAGTEGTKVTGRAIRDRLFAEAEGNVAIKVRESDGKDSVEVAGRGELQLGVLIEQMRREGYEMTISRPRVLFKTDELTGQKLEPVEEVQVDVDDEFSGTVINKISERKGEMTDMRPSGAGKTRIKFLAPSRGLIGYQSEFLSSTRGTGIMNRIFHSYAPHKGPIPTRHTGVLISNGQGVSVAYAMWKLEDRGPMMIEPGIPVYEGMIVGEHTRDNDLDINILEGKKLTNVRASGADEAVRLTPPIRMTLEKAIAYINDDELVEITPKSIRLRKKHLDPNVRKRMAKQAEAESA
ncbi:MAG: translational GTPase TypA [Proteobacteria bacterium]|nr:translational GTPase TypA [Pseudomonadota bacterium]